MLLKFRLYWFYKVLPVVMKNKILNGSLSSLSFPAKHTKGAGAAEKSDYWKPPKQLRNRITARNTLLWDISRTNPIKLHPCLPSSLTYFSLSTDTPPNQAITSLHSLKSCSGLTATLSILITNLRFPLLDHYLSDHHHHFVLNLRPNSPLSLAPPSPSPVPSGTPDL